MLEQRKVQYPTKVSPLLWPKIPELKIRPQAFFVVVTMLPFMRKIPFPDFEWEGGDIALCKPQYDGCALQVGKMIHQKSMHND